jgi:hypothetical protein
MATTGKLILLVLVLVPCPSHTMYYNRVIQVPLLVTLTKTEYD